MFLKSLRFEEKRPTPLYYYRELQNLRDPLNFVSGRGEMKGAAKRSQIDMKSQLMKTKPNSCRLHTSERKATIL